MSTIEILWLVLKVLLAYLIILTLYENYLDRKIMLLRAKFLKESKRK